jgi:hypothetical protein
LNKVIFVPLPGSEMKIAVGASSAAKWNMKV